MPMGVFDFPAIKRKIERQEQKADFDANNPPPPEWYNLTVCWPAGRNAPYIAPESDPA